ncbi:MAG: gamma-glutamyltranspeptidase / glutathione hydrolase [Solirubrobacteraceae bacterium]|nr:gamma-glutamyltranspeptidase / glutathione hydrolase [Solirubrobacteraceae bacterium]
MKGVVAAGHPVTADAGADALRAGGNAVDAALACLCAGFVAEPLLTGLGAGGYMLVCPPGGEDVLLDFFVEAAGRGREHKGHAPLVAVDVSFGDATQLFYAGAASVGAYGMPAGICEAHRRYGTLPLAEIVAPAVRAAREGVVINEQQAYLFEILAGILESSEEALALFGAPRLGDTTLYPELAGTLERLAAEGSDPFYTGDIAEAVCRAVRLRGGLLTPRDLRAYEVVPREPVRAAYRGREVITNPPPSAGGILIAAALEQLEAGATIVAALEYAQRRRTPEFLQQLGSTTHVSVIDTQGWACAVTVSNGEGSGIIVPGTGLHLNNMMGEEDLSPLGFFTHPPGRRLPSMMSPTVVRRDGAVELCLGSAGSNRIRSAILQVIARVVDDGLEAQAAIDAPRLHWEDGVVYCEPGIDADALEAEGRTVARFRAPNLFFGGAQCVVRDADGTLRGAGDPRRGGVAVAA